MSSNPHILTAREKFKAGDLEGAIADFDLAIKQEEHPDYYSERGVAYLHLRQGQRALEDMNKSLELQPDYSYRYASRAYVRDKLGDTQGAVEDYKEAIRLDPNDAISHNNLGLLEEKLGYLESAKKRVKRADQLAAAEEYLQKQAQESAQQKSQPSTQTENKGASQSLLMGVFDVFRSKSTFKEFMIFVKNGFKLPEEKKN